MNYEMVKVNKGGQMALYTKANGKMVKLTVMVSCTMLMAMYIKVIGWKIKQMVMEPTLMLMVLSMLEAGRMINNMGKVLKRGQMVQYMKGCTLKVKSMAMVS
jgi:hypothetical protein